MALVSDLPMFNQGSIYTYVKILTVLTLVDVYYQDWLCNQTKHGTPTNSECVHMERLVRVEILLERLYCLINLKFTLLDCQVLKVKVKLQNSNTVFIGLCIGVSLWTSLSIRCRSSLCASDPHWLRVRHRGLSLRHSTCLHIRVEEFSHSTIEKWFGI